MDKPAIHLENNWSLKDFWRHGEIPKTIALNQQQNMCCLPAHEQETIMGHNVGQNQHKECVACTCKNRSYLNNDVCGRKNKNRHCQREIANQTAPRCGCLSTIWLPCRLSASVKYICLRIAAASEIEMVNLAEMAFALPAMKGWYFRSEQQQTQCYRQRKKDQCEPGLSLLRDTQIGTKKQFEPVPSVG